MQLPLATRISARRGGSHARKPWMSSASTSVSASPRGAAAAAAAAGAKSSSTPTTPYDVGASAASTLVQKPPVLKKVAMVSLGCPKNTVDGESCVVSCDILAPNFFGKTGEKDMHVIGATAKKGKRFQFQSSRRQVRTN